MYVASARGDNRGKINLSQFKILKSARFLRVYVDTYLGMYLHKYIRDVCKILPTMYVLCKNYATQLHI